jgi:hypothetical protein
VIFKHFFKLKRFFENLMKTHTNTHTLKIHPWILQDSLNPRFVTSASLFPGDLPNSYF